MLSKFVRLQILLLLLTSGYSNATIYDLGARYFESLGEERSLPSCCTAIVQDKTGFIWIGTQEGLIRFDGYEYRLFTSNKNDPGSLSGNYVRTLWVAPDNRLWVGTLSDGISIYDPKYESFTRFQYQEDNNNSLLNNRVEAIIGDGKNAVWIGTNNGLNHFNLTTQRFTRYINKKTDKSSLPDNHVRTLFMENQKTLLVGTWRGLSRLNLESNTFELVALSNNQKNDPEQQIVSSIFKANDGKLWIGTTGNGLVVLSKDGKVEKIPFGKKNPTRISHPWVKSITQPKVNEIWVGTMGGGIDVMDPFTLTIKDRIKHIPSESSSIGSNAIGVLFTDNSGLLWVGTWGGGLNRYNTKNEAFRILHHIPSDPNSISNDFVTSILELDNEQIWLGSQNDGIDIINPSVGLVARIEGDLVAEGEIESTSIKSMIQMNENSIWIGTQQKGLFEVSNKHKILNHFTKEQGLYFDQIDALLANNDQSLWIATTKGLNRLNTSNNEIEKIYVEQSTFGGASKDVNFNQLALSQSGELWSGSSNGLYKFSNDTRKLKRFQHDPKNPKSLSHNHISGLFFDNLDQLWISTGKGLDKLIMDKSSKVTFNSTYQQHSHSESLFGNILEDKLGRLWTNDHLYNPKTNELTFLRREDGVDIGNAVLGASEKTKDGLLLFGGTNGLLVIKPELFKPWSFEAPIVVSQLKINGEKAIPSLDNSINLNNQSKSFSVEFSMLDFSAPEKYKYQYRLHGYDNGWIKTDHLHRVARYTNLAPGNYQLEIRAENRYSEISQSNLLLSIYQAPLWYQSLFTRLLFVLLGISLIYFVYLYRMGILRKQKEILKQQVLNQTASIRMLNQIGQDITSSVDLDKVVERIYMSLKSTLDTHAFLLGTIHGDSLRIPLIVEDNSKITNTKWELNNLALPASWCIKNRAEFIVMQEKDLDNYDGVEMKIPQYGVRTRSVIYLPLLIENKVIGCLSVQSLVEDAYNSEQLEIIRTISRYAASAVANALGYKDLYNARKELEQAYVELEKISFTDQLTGVYNRRFLSNFSKSELANLKRENYHKAEEDSVKFGIILIDIDFFKSVNDEYGHDAGDSTIKQFAEIISTTCRESDWIIRWGGEEFLVVARFIERKKLEALAERIRFKVENSVLNIGFDQKVTKTCSIGISTFPYLASNEINCTIEEAIKLADVALYVAKNSGRNGWVSLYENKRTKQNNLIEQAALNLKSIIDSEELLFDSSINKTELKF